MLEGELFVLLHANLELLPCLVANLILFHELHIFHGQGSFVFRLLELQLLLKVLDFILDGLGLVLIVPVRRIVQHQVLSVAGLGTEQVRRAELVEVAVQQRVASLHVFVGATVSDSRICAWACSLEFNR